MTRRERIIFSEILKQWPQTKPDDARKWIHTLHPEFDNLSPFAYNEKFGGKRFKKRLGKVEFFD